MYNRALDTFRTVAEEGSFSKAAEKLYISHTAVIKQIKGLESHLEVKLFTRTSQGASLTPAGQVLYTEALQMIRYSEKATARVRQAYASAPRTLRIGSSMLYPCHFFMDLWDGIREQCPQFSLKIVTFNDDWNRLAHVGNDVDFVIGAFNPDTAYSDYQFLPVGIYRFCLAVPRSHPLSGKKLLSFSDLSGQPLLIMQPGHSPLNDQIRKMIVQEYPDINLVDIDYRYDISTFNHCAEIGAVLLSLECWDRVHPDIKTIPLREESSLPDGIPYGIVYQKNPDDDVLEFIKILKKHLTAWEKG